MASEAVVAGVAVATLGFASFPAFTVLLEGLLFRERTRPGEFAMVGVGEQRLLRHRVDAAVDDQVGHVQRIRQRRVLRARGRPQRTLLGGALGGQRLAVDAGRVQRGDVVRHRDQRRLAVAGKARQQADACQQQLLPLVQRLYRIDNGLPLQRQWQEAGCRLF